jgi:hypothetical protein
MRVWVSPHRSTAHPHRHQLCLRPQDPLLGIHQVTMLYEYNNAISLLFLSLRDFPLACYFLMPSIRILPFIEQNTNNVFPFCVSKRDFVVRLGTLDRVYEESLVNP